MKARLVGSSSMTRADRTLRFLSAALALAVIITGNLPAQVYSPKVLVQGQVDSSSLENLARNIYLNANALTPGEKAEAIWRFFLTDGRFVPPGFWYHIAGWAYEEPAGEVLDPLKLLNSYGFGLCYQVAPLLEAVWEAGGFEDARVWFLTGHTVAEVFYDGAYHHFDSDMMGYNVVGQGDLKSLPVASVLALAKDPQIFLNKLMSPKTVDTTRVSQPWYPADLREGAIAELAAVFSSTGDNWLFPYRRFPAGHTMAFVLRPGEQLIRYFKPEKSDVYYLPYALDGTGWREFPNEIEEHAIRTEDGPRSQKDERSWATGRLVYRPVLSDPSAYYPSFGTSDFEVGPESGREAGLKSKPGFNENLRLPAVFGEPLKPDLPEKPARAVFEVNSPWVIIDASFSAHASLGRQDTLSFETSSDAGRHWDLAERLSGPFEGRWNAEPAILARSPHGRLTVVSGKYAYLVRLTLEDLGPRDTAGVEDLIISTRLQVNPRTLPALHPGLNHMTYHPGNKEVRRALLVNPGEVKETAFRIRGLGFRSENNQGLLFPSDGETGEIVFELQAPGGQALTGFNAGGRFLDLSEGWAPDKLTAETRPTDIGRRPDGGSSSRVSATLAWSTAPGGPYNILWEYPGYSAPRDGQRVEQTLRWPEVDEFVARLPQGTSRAYVRYRVEGMGLDNLRLAATEAAEPTSALVVTHQWFEGDAFLSRDERISKADAEHMYQIEIPSGRRVMNQAIILACPAPGE